MTALLQTISAALLELAETAPEWTPDQVQPAKSVLVLPVSVSEPEEAEEPIPLPGGAVAPFPVQVFPDPVQRLMREAADSLFAPLDFVGVPVLAALSAAIGNSRHLRIKPGWIERPLIWTAIVGRPGDAKSPALREAIRPILDRQKRYKNEYQQAKKEYDEDLALYEQELDHWKGQMRKQATGKYVTPGQAPVKPEEPFSQQVATTNATLEALNRILFRNSRGCLFYKDELAGWVGGMNAYRGGKGGDLEAWLEFYTCSPVILNRTNDKAPLQIDSPFVPVTGGIQPDVLPDLLEERGKDGGFLDRILFSWPDSLPLGYSHDGISDETASDYRDVIDALYELEPASEENGSMASVELRFTADGYRTWHRWIDSHCAEVNQPEFPDHLRGPWSKLRAYAARLALIIQVTRYVCRETEVEHVEHRSMVAAAALVTYFKSHLRRVYSRLRATDEDRKVLQLVEWLRKRKEAGKGASASSRDLYSNNVADLTNSEDAVLLMRVTAKRGYATLEQAARNRLIIHLAEPKTPSAGSTAGQVPGVGLVPSGTREQAQNNKSAGCRVTSEDPENFPPPDDPPAPSTFEHFTPTE